MQDNLKIEISIFNMKEVFSRIIHERALLMSRAEAEVLCECPQLGEEIYRGWTQLMDAAIPEDYLNPPEYCVHKRSLGVGEWRSRNRGTPSINDGRS